MRDIDIVIKEIGCMFKCWEQISKVLKRTMSNEDYQKAEKYYSNLNNNFRNYTAEVTKNIIERSSYDNALNAKKIDPYVAGGIADGIAGVGAGVYAASNMADRNERIDEARKEGAVRVRKQQQFTNDSEKRLASAFYALQDLVFTVSEAKQIYLSVWEEIKANEIYKETEKAISKKKDIVFWVVLFIVWIALLAISVVLGIDTNFFVIFVIIVFGFAIGYGIMKALDKVLTKMFIKSLKNEER